MDKQPFLSAIEQICEEKGISREKVLETIEMALAAAYKKEYSRKGQNIKVNFDPETGQMEVFQIKLVVDESMLKAEEESPKEEQEELKSKKPSPEEKEKKVRFNPEKHIMIDEVKNISPKEKALFKEKKLTEALKKKIKPGDEIWFPLEIASDFGRIAAQTAKQVIIQRVREAEREAIFNEYKEKEGQIVSGIVQRIEGDRVFVDLGKATGIIFPEDQVPHENYRPGQRLKVYIAEVQRDTRGSAIILSRTHPKMVSQLFALEVPEISTGTVQIKSIAREAGSRTKIAVASTEERVDPIGSMIGQRGSRVQTVINELNGEKIDIIQWSEDPAEYISNALSPAKVLDVEIDKKKNQAKAIVPEDQLSLAIGAQGQNVRLAARLTGWKIDIVNQETGQKAPLPTEKEKTEKETPKKKSQTESYQKQTPQKKEKEKEKETTSEKAN